MDKQEILNRINIPKFYQDFIPSLKVNGKSESLGLCPFHDDHNPSFSVNVESGLFRCFACSEKGNAFTFYQKIKDVDFTTALKEISEMSGTTTASKTKVVATFRYCNSDGKLLYIKERLEPGRNGRPKEFIFKHLKGNDWALGRSCDPVFYNLPQVIKSTYALIVEGEAKADLLASWGLVATCLDSGANSPVRDEYIQILEGMEKIAILPDNDTPGREYAEKIAGALYCKVSELKVVELPGLQEKEDIIDWIKIPGNDKPKLIELVKNTALWTPPKECKNDSTMVLTRLDSLFQEPEENTTWLVDKLLPTGGFSVVVAKPKVGKSTFARTLALHVAKGESFLDRTVTKGAAIYLALEEKRSEVRRHFRDMGAIGNEEIHIYTGGTPVDAIRQIRDATERIKPVLVIIDPLFRLTKVRDGNDYIQVTNAIDPLLRLARDTGTHVICVHHSRKGECAAGDSFLGSQAIFGSVDTMLIMKRHDRYRTLQTIQRYGEDLEETILDFDKTTRLVTVGGSRQEEDTNVLKKAIIEFLSTQTEPVTEIIINQGVEGSVKFKCKALRELVSENKINREGKGAKGNPFKYSTILLPSIYVEVEKENPEMTGNPHGCQGYSTIQDFAAFKENEKSKIVEYSVKNEDENGSQKPVIDVPFEVENVEVE